MGRSSCNLGSSHEPESSLSKLYISGHLNAYVANSSIEPDANEGYLLNSERW